MIAIFLKELRENAKWAAVIFGVLGVLVYLQVREAGPLLLFQLPEPTTILFAPLAGLLMGIVQSLFETRPDNWAFVIHRPVTRRQIFIGKCAAGLLLLYISLELPCLLACAWAARPGHLPTPFQWRMVLPTLADVLNAGVYYFVGMVLTLRKARWLGTRLLPLGLALISTVAVRFTLEFWQAALVLVGAQFLGAWAAWGVFATAGTVHRGAGARMGLGAMIYFGALAVCFIPIGLMSLFFSTTTWQQQRVDRNGKVMLVTWTLRGNERTGVVTDLAGRRLPEYEGVDIDDPALADRFVRPTVFLEDEQNDIWPLSAEIRGYRSPLPGVIRLSSVAKAGTRLPFHCMFDVPNRVIDLYDPLTGVKIGTVSPGGFSREGAGPIGRFPGRPLNPGRQQRVRALAFPSAVYWMELDHRAVHPVYNASNEDPVISAQDFGPPADPMIAILTATRVLVTRPSGEVLYSIPHGVDVRTHAFSPNLLPDNQHLLLGIWAAYPENTASDPTRVLEFAPDGTLLRQTVVPMFTDVRALGEARAAAFGALYPAGLLPLYFGWHQGFGFDGLLDMNTRGYPRLFLTCLILSSLLSAAGTFLLARRCGFAASKTIAWTLANLVLGPAGVIVLLGVSDWPPREPCTACGRMRFLERQTCPHCDAGPAPAEEDGREIFEPCELVEVGAR